MPYYSLTRRHDTIIFHLKTGWRKLRGPVSETPGNEISMTGEFIEKHYQDPAFQNNESINALSTLFSFLGSIKSEFDGYNWKIKDVPEKALDTYYSDVSFYLFICYVLQKASSLWVSLLPAHILPPAYLGRVNLKRSTYDEIVHKMPDTIAGHIPEFDWRGTPIEDTIRKLDSASDQYKGYQCIPRIIRTLKNNLNEFIPHSKADEQKITNYLKDLTYKLNHTPSPCNTFAMITNAASTGLIKSHDVEDHLVKILAECHKYNNPAHQLSQLKSCIKRQFNHNNPISYDNTQLQTNARESLMELKAKIKNAKQEMAPSATINPACCGEKAKMNSLTCFAT